MYFERMSFVYKRYKFTDTENHIKIWTLRTSKYLNEKGKRTIICMSCTFFEHIMRNGRLQPMTSNEITYSLHLVKDSILKFYVT